MLNVSTTPPHATFCERDQILLGSGCAALYTCASSRLPLAICRCARSRFNHFHKITDCPERVRDASGHCWRAANRNVGLHKIVKGVMQCDPRFEVFQFLGKRIGQPRKASAVHPQNVILFFNVACGNQIDDWISLAGAKIRLRA
jgi:hypothetical protein